MAEIFEIIMVLGFGASWPFNVINSYKQRTAKGKSIAFLLCIFFGYVAGIISKFLNTSYMQNFSNNWYVLIFYFINITMVVLDIALYIRNKRLDLLAKNQ